NIFLYTHWGCYELEELAKKVIRQGWRMQDACYFTRIMFCEMVKGEEAGETGYGICNHIHGDIEVLIVIDLEKRTMITRQIYNDTPTKTETFDEIQGGKVQSFDELSGGK
ncbi:unnamed protein product, partial [marine sediment metagenome]